LICEKFPPSNTKVPPTAIKLSGQSATVAIDTTKRRDRKAPGGSRRWTKQGCSKQQLPAAALRRRRRAFFYSRCVSALQTCHPPNLTKHEIPHRRKRPRPSGSLPGDQKAKVMRKIMSVQPTERVLLDGSNSFEKAVLKLRKEGYGLIDVQRQEVSFACVWLRETKSLFNGNGADVAMLLWEMQEENGPETTVLTWRI
jgi:hypothetical protein